ncbi:hypothetical protein [Hyalangium gracile]|uniref:hypothetical protein n=1 Tax=Hyalangium gracile TaxID=394092 RepID=UPI001CCD6F2A|nr:hypothetical protein [Hyalangium gracile]
MKPLASRAAWSGWGLVWGLLLAGCATSRAQAPLGGMMMFEALRYRPSTPGDAPAPAAVLVTERGWQEAEQGALPVSGCPRKPEGWPEEAASDAELLAPLLGCSTVADFLAAQRGVNMARVVERLGDWSAVRLGAFGPLVDARASRVLNGKRVSFLLKATEDYGAYAQVFAFFIIHAAYDDELDLLLRALARDKQLGQTLGPLEPVRQELAERGLKLEDYSDRDERAEDILRGLERAARDALSGTPVSDGARYQRLSAQRAQLPPAYQQALEEVERALVSEHYTAGNMALGGMDQLTFGVPLGFYHLVAGTAHGVKELTQGQYEQATRELAPAALLVALYAGGRGARYLAGVEGAEARAWRSSPALRMEALKQVAWRVGERLGVEGLGTLARYIRASREAAVFVAAGGEPAAVALHEARGNVARAQAWLSEAPPERVGAAEPRASTGRAPGGLASLVDEAAGYSAEVVEARLHQAELDASGPRLPADVALLQRLSSTLSSPPPGVPQGSALWSEYVSYRQRRLADLRQGKVPEGPLRWEPYERMRSAFARGLSFERAMVALLRADALLPPARRRWLKGFSQPRVEVHVGVSKPGVPGMRFADVLIIEEQPPAGQSPRVETFSFKSRYLASLEGGDLVAQMRMDARAAVTYYGGTLDILRPSLRIRARVQRVRLVYEGGELIPMKGDDLKRAVDTIRQEINGVEVLFP